MGRIKFYCAGTTQAAVVAGAHLRNQGFAFGTQPGEDITDLLLDVPSFQKNGSLRDGEDAVALFSRLSPTARIWGGDLSSLENFQSIDLLNDPAYLTENAAITADCALKIAAPLLETTWKLSRVLIIGWGRIGKKLGKLLTGLGAQVTVCARKASDRALLRALGYEAIDLSGLPAILPDCDLLFNTAPAPILDAKQLDACPRCIPIDLASVQGLSGKRVLPARGLPGRLAPRASGQLIADTVLRLGKEVF